MLAGLGPALLALKLGRLWLPVPGAPCGSS